MQNGVLPNTRTRANISHLARTSFLNTRMIRYRLFSKESWRHSPMTRRGGGGSCGTRWRSCNYGGMSRRLQSRRLSSRNSSRMGRLSLLTTGVCEHPTLFRPRVVLMCLNTAPEQSYEPLISPAQSCEVLISHLRSTLHEITLNCSQHGEMFIPKKSY